MSKLFLFSKSAPDITDAVLLLIGILLFFLLLDWGIKRATSTYHRRKERIDRESEEFLKREIGIPLEENTGTTLSSEQKQQ